MGKLIEADALLAEYDRLHVGEPGRARKMIEDAPEAVVRCKDCIYWDTQDRSTGGIAKCNYYSAERYCVYTNSKDYCSGGERKTDE